jgi:hypothetical protein
MFAAIRLASSLVSSLAADRAKGILDQGRLSDSEQHSAALRKIH